MSIHCTECGSTLHSSREVRKRAESIGRPFGDDCFRLSYGGAIFGLIIGVLIIFSGLIAFFAGSIGNVMERFGRWMGNWGRDFGEWMGNWGRGFGDALRSIINLQSIRILGSIMMIIIGLVIIVAVLYNLNQTRSQ